MSRLAAEQDTQTSVATVLTLPCGVCAAADQCARHARAVCLGAVLGRVEGQGAADGAEGAERGETRLVVGVVQSQCTGLMPNVGELARCAAIHFDATCTARIVVRWRSRLTAFLTDLVLWRPQVQKLAKESPDFARFIADPTISREQKGAALSSISSEMKLSELTSRFIGALSCSVQAAFSRMAFEGWFGAPGVPLSSYVKAGCCL